MLLGEANKKVKSTDLRPSYNDKGELVFGDKGRKLAMAILRAGLQLGYALGKTRSGCNALAVITQRGRVKPEEMARPEVPAPTALQHLGRMVCCYLGVVQDTGDYSAEYPALCLGDIAGRLHEAKLVSAPDIANAFRRAVMVALQDTDLPLARAQGLSDKMNWIADLLASEYGNPRLTIMGMVMAITRARLVDRPSMMIKDSDAEILALATMPPILAEAIDPIHAVVQGWHLKKAAERFQETNGREPTQAEAEASFGPLLVDQDTGVLLPNPEGWKTTGCELRYEWFFDVGAKIPEASQYKGGDPYAKEVRDHRMAKELENGPGKRVRNRSGAKADRKVSVWAECMPWLEQVMPDDLYQELVDKVEAAEKALESKDKKRLAVKERNKIRKAAKAKAGRKSEPRLKEAEQPKKKHKSEVKFMAVCNLDSEDEEGSKVVYLDSESEAELDLGNKKKKKRTFVEMN